MKSPPVNPDPRPAAPDAAPLPERAHPALEMQEIHLSDYLAVIKRRKWVILLFSAVVVGLVTLFSLGLPRSYTATAQIVIERKLYPVTNTEERINQDMDDLAFYETQYNLLKSRALALQVIKQLGPEQIFLPAPEQEPSLLAWLRDMLPKRAPEPPVGPADPATAEEERLVDEYLGSLTIEPVTDTRLVNISFASESPSIAARVANAHARGFIERNIQLKLSAAQQGLKWLTEQVAEQKEKVEASQAQVQQYLKSQNVVSFEERQNIVSQKLMELNSNLTRAKNERIARQAVFEQMQKADFEGDNVYSLPEVAQDSIILGLRNQIIQLRSRQIELSSNFGPLHPKMQEVSTRIQELEEEKNKEIRRLQGTIRADLDRARQYEGSLQAALEAQKLEAQALSTKASEYTVLSQEVRSNQDAYDILLRQAKEMHLTSGLETGNVKVVDEAKAPSAPVRSRKKLYVLLSVAASLFMGTFLAFFLEYMDQSVKTSDDVKNKLRLPVLGMVPHYRFSRGDKEHVLFWDDPRLKKKKPVTDYYYYYGVNAANRLIQHLQWRVQQDQGRVFAVVSAGAGEGKTTVLANAAKILGHRGLRVLAVDADTHHPSLHGMFGLNGSGPGLTTAMKEALPAAAAAPASRGPSGPADAPISERLGRIEVGGELEKELLLSVKIVGENLSLLTAGEGQTELSGVFSLALLGKFLELLKTRYDIVLVDTPPLLEVAEAVPLAAMVDGAVLIIRAGRLPEKSLVEAVESLKNANAKVLGAVLNDMAQ